VATRPDPIEAALDALTDASFDDFTSTFGGLDNPELYFDNTLPVDVIQFVEDSQFLGNLLHADPRVLELLWLMEQPTVRESFVQIGKGGGKSFVGSADPTYNAYKLLKMRRPQRYFSLAESTEIVCINVSVGLFQAKNVVFKTISDLVSKSPWFQQHAPNVPLTQSITFTDRNIALYCGHSNSTAFLGFATFCAVLDEANFMVNNSNRNVAGSLYAALAGSCKTRFPTSYKLAAISSAGAPNAWLQAEVESIKREGKEIPLTPHGLRPHTFPSSAGDALDDALDDAFDEDKP
jgi:hypothetical protein